MTASQMNNLDSLLDVEKHDHLGILTVKKGFFENVADPDKSFMLVDVCNEMEEDSEIKGVLMLNEPGAFGEASYEIFVNAFIKSDDPDEQANIDKMIRSRQMNSFRSFVLKTVAFRKLFFFGLSGRIVTPFFGISLSGDFRFAESSMRFSLAHIKHNLHPSGGLPFFLGKYLPNNLATEILYKTREIPANKAMELGLVSEIFADDNFKEKTIGEALKISDMNLDVIRLTKKLMSSYKDDLEDYFRQESMLVGF